jgi:hypothetical protein
MDAGRRLHQAGDDRHAEAGFRSVTLNATWAASAGAAGLAPGDMEGIDFSDRQAARAAIAAKLAAAAE